MAFSILCFNAIFKVKEYKNEICKSSPSVTRRNNYDSAKMIE